jgi:hypothetical protein
MTRKALAQPAGLRGFWPGALLPVGQRPQRVCSLVRQSGSDRRAPSRNSQQRCYTSLRLGALGMVISLYRDIWFFVS